MHCSCDTCLEQKKGGWSFWCYHNSRFYVWRIEVFVFQGEKKTDISKKKNKKYSPPSELKKPCKEGSFGLIWSTCVIFITYYFSAMAFSGQISWQQKQAMHTSASTCGKQSPKDKADTGQCSMQVPHFVHSSGSACGLRSVRPWSIACIGSLL